jgi:predicted permease
MKRRFHLSLGGLGLRRDVDRELEFYLDMRTQELIDQGTPPAMARRAAEEAFGNRRAVAARCRAIRRSRFRWDMLRGLGQDVRFALRGLRRSPGFAGVIIVTLALGIGANTAIFSLINGVLLQPLPYARGGDLVRLHQPSTAAGGTNVNFSPQEVADYADQSRALSAVVEYHSMPFILLGLDEPQRVQTGVVSAGFFDLLGVEPVLGRTFLPGEDQPGAEPVLVLSHHTWLEVFGADGEVIGRKVEMNDRMHVVVGVLPEIPHHPDRNDVYMPVAACPFRSSASWDDNRGARGLTVFGRIDAGHSLEQVRADLATVAGRMHEQFTEHYADRLGLTTTAVPLRDELVQRARPSLYVLLGAAGFLLLIVCANVANLTLARLVTRERELAIRATLGAGRGRLFRQLLTESLVLALVGGGVGLALAYGGLDLLVAFVERLTARAAEVRIDRMVLGFTLALSLGTALAISLLPALPARVSLANELREGGGGAIAGGRHRLRSMLIVSQVAVSFVLLVGAGLMLRTFVNLIRVDPGFDAEQVMTARLDLDWHEYRDPESRNGFAATLEEELRAAPGIQSVAFTSSLPLNAQPWRQFALSIEGAEDPEGLVDLQVDLRVVSQDYFDLLEIPIMRGRPFQKHDGREARIAVVNALMAERFLGGVKGASGKRIRIGGAARDWLTIVGVVDNVRHDGLGASIHPAVYVPQQAMGMRDMRVLVRSTLDEANTAALLRRTVAGLDGTQPLSDIRSMTTIRRESLASPRATTLLIGGFALLALVVTAAGIGGVIAYTVNQRTREIGIRMALGADRESVLLMVLRRGLREAGYGLLLGLAGAIILTRVLEGMLAGSGLLFGVGATDIVTFVAVSCVLLGVAIAACVGPARRATSIDPLHALRSE